MQCINNGDFIKAAVAMLVILLPDFEYFTPPVLRT